MKSKVLVDKGALQMCLNILQRDPSPTARQAAAELEGTAGFDIDSLNGLLREMLDAMERYEMDTHDTPPFEHRKLMDRARLAVTPNEKDQAT